MYEWNKPDFPRADTETIKRFICALLASGSMRVSDVKDAMDTEFHAAGLSWSRYGFDKAVAELRSEKKVWRRRCKGGRRLGRVVPVKDEGQLFLF